MAAKHTIPADSPITPEPVPSGDVAAPVSVPSLAAVPEPVPEPAPIAADPAPQTFPGLVAGEPTPPIYTPTRVVICWGEGAGGSRAYGWVTEAHTVSVTETGPLLEVRATDIGEGASYRLTLYPVGAEVPAQVIAAGRPYALGAHDPRLI